MRDLNNGWMGYQIIAAYHCWPKQCCNNNILTGIPPCINAARGFQADQYIFRLSPGNTYMLTMPIITGMTY
jgi:hypothetical protein